MIRALVIVALLAGTAVGHGRDPFVVRLEHRPGHEQDVLAGMSIGLVVSHDGGATWRWTCEEAIHYGDPFDPDYAYAAGGSILAQTFIGAGVNHTGCNFEPTMLGTLTVSSVTASRDGTLFAAAADLADSAIYKSIDDGATFTLASNPGQPNDWWTSIEVSRTDPQRIYLAGYRLLPDTSKQFLLFVSRDGGGSFTPMSITGLVVVRSSRMMIAGIGANDVVYVEVKTETDSGGDAVYRSTDAGANWTRIISSMDKYGLAFLARGSGELVAGTRTSGAWSSSDGTTWTPLANAPHISALAETAAGEVWAGTQNSTAPGVMDVPPIPSDGYALMKSTDLATWVPVLRLSDLGPPACTADTPVFVQCAATPLGLGTPWCCLAGQLGITSTEIDCTGANSCGYGPDVAGDMTTPPPGCHCDSGGGAGLLVALALIVRKRASPRQQR